LVPELPRFSLYKNSGVSCAIRLASTLCSEFQATWQHTLFSMSSSLAYGLLLAIARCVVGHGPHSSPPTPNHGHEPYSLPVTPSHDSNVHTHGQGFTPDFYLSVTYENYTVACQQHMSVLVNRTSPGPILRLPAGKTSWVRVCNDMDAYNTTMV
jgi:L-ascorbate oxidase